MRWLLVVCLLYPSALYPQLLINEIACNVSGSDWVELFLCSEESLYMDISSLYVTMYYGTNERLAQTAVTIYSHDRPETGWDDRFVVVHLTDSITPDECDATGDTNGNGVLDVYCNNYINSLWNTDCVVAIDTDDDPANGGIIDFVAYSNRDGTLNQYIGQYVVSAILQEQWMGSASEEYMVDIGKSGLLEYQSIIRKSINDSNSLDDFIVTPFMTPGRPNMLPVSHANNTFITVSKKIVLSKKAIEQFKIFVLQPCTLRMRLFSSQGYKIFETPLLSALPGICTIDWIRHLQQMRYGLYLGTVEAQDTKNRQRVEFYCIVVE